MFEYKIPVLRFGAPCYFKAMNEWGCNCGPGALAAMTISSLDQARLALSRCGDIKGFDECGHTKETLMKVGLERLSFSIRENKSNVWPKYGLVRVVWHGPWNDYGKGNFWPPHHSHWVGSVMTHEGLMIFDINAIVVGGFINMAFWEDVVIPDILKDIDADGSWTMLESWDIFIS